ncbi:oxygenase MpaB family protein [Nonomuraea sp. NPDC049419]|uniref:oxygenase MpaB family protein n=1 Tax=Nonomuraea sp. NPDC049419 TaxID=3155772 RepID=UPI003430A39D
MKPTVTPGGGLFGPRSITWRVHAETPTWPAAVRAFQLQALHPRTIRGVVQNHLLDDAEAVRAHLRRRLGFVALRTFGTREQAEEAYERAREVHARLVGLDTATGTLFRLDEPENLRWVHCAEVASHLQVARLSGVALTAGERDAYVAEQRRAASLAGLTDVPGTAGELDDHLTGMRAHLSATDEARELLRLVVTPPLSLRPGTLPAVGALAFATLPGWARSMYGCPGDAAAGYAAGAALRALRAAAMAMPERLVAPEIRAARALMRAAARTRGADVAA